MPLREQLKRTDLLLGARHRRRPDAQGRVVDHRRGQERELGYDQLIVTLGSISRDAADPRAARSTRSASRRCRTRSRCATRSCNTLERAESVEDEAARRALLTYVFVGAGYAGLEGLAELQDFAADVVDLYPRSRVEGLRFILVEARDRVMPEISADLAAFAAAELRQPRDRGADVGTTVERISADSVELSDGEVVPCRTVAWTAGVRPAPGGREARAAARRSAAGSWSTATARSRAATTCGRSATPPRCPIPPGPGSRRRRRASTRCARAARSAGNVAAALGAGRPKPFTYKTLGVFVDMGHQKAVAETLGIKWRGFPAWFLARTYHLAMMPGTKRKLRLVVDWTVDLLFGRDASELGQLGHPPVLEHADAPAGRRAEDPPAVRR